MDLLYRPIVGPIREITMHRTPGRQVFGKRPPLTTSGQDIHNAIDDLTNDNIPTAAAVIRWRDQRFDHQPFLIGQVARVTELAPVISRTVFSGPHAAPRESVSQTESQMIQRVQGGH